MITKEQAAHLSKLIIVLAGAQVGSACLQLESNRADAGEVGFIMGNLQDAHANLSDFINSLTEQP